LDHLGVSVGGEGCLGAAGGGGAVVVGLSSSSKDSIAVMPSSISALSDKNSGFVGSASKLD